MKPLRNYMASAILTEAIRQKAVTETEADIVIDTVVYKRSPWYLSRELGIPSAEVVKTYETSLGKLKRWFLSGDIEAELLLI
ncbi:MAG: hypothetical protein QME51_10280, partial [Planctomycetota bacterium]|nr:hypothetical protein [Planctomycetota bacterium]